MNNLQDNILYKTRQHKIVLILNFVKWFLTVWIPFWILLYLVSNLGWIVNIIIYLVFVLVIFYYNYFFWNKSYFLVTNKQISQKVRNWIFSKFAMSIYFENIRDIAYSKNNLFHYMFNYWTFFARSSAWADWDFMITRVPDIEKLYKIINQIHILPADKRETLDRLWASIKTKKESKEDVIKNEYNKLISIKWIKEVVLLSDNDKKYLFENEEDRNHWVFETIRKQVTFCFIHDSDFREADASIVLKLWSKIIFPAVSFHEITRPSTVSSSPWIETHKYLSQKFEKLVEDDATVLVGFDV